MTTEEFIIAVFCRIDDRMPKTQTQTPTGQTVSESIGDNWGTVCTQRWLFPSVLSLVERDHDGFLAQPSFFTVIDSYGIELIHPIREGRSEQQVGKKGNSN